MASCGTGACHRATKETGGSGARSTWLGGIACGCLGAEGGSSKRDEQVRSLKERDFILFPLAPASLLTVPASDISRSEPVTAFEDQHKMKTYLKRRLADVGEAAWGDYGPS